MTSSVHSLIQEQVRRSPGEPAVVSGSAVLTYGQLNARANQVARLLRSLGVAADEPVGTCLSRSPDAVVSALAIVKAGAAPVLLDPAAPLERTLAQIRACGVRVLITSTVGCDLAAQLLPAVEELGVRAVRLDADRHIIAGLPADDLADVHLTPDSAAHVVYTSGSVTTPKAVVSRHETVGECVALAREEFGFTRDDRVAWCSSPGFGVSLVNELWPALGTGATVLIPDAGTLLSPQRLRDWILQERITVIHLVATLAVPLCELDWPADCPLRLLLTTGERFRLGTATDPPFTIAITYGSTETTHITGRLGRGESVGRPLGGASVYVLDASGERLPDGEAGVVHVGGRRLARGYLAEPALTASSFLPDPFAGVPGARMYRTGDLGRIDADGELVLVGRVDRQVKVRGQAVNLDEVEAVVAAQAGAGEAAVVAIGDDSRVVAYLAGVDGAAVAALHKALAVRLPRAHLPAEFVLLDRLPRTVTGKVDRAALPAPRRTSSSSPAPDAEGEGELAGIWCELLEREGVGIDDDFFELGGHSLLAARMVLEIEERRGVKIDLTAFYERPTLRALSGLVSAATQPGNVLVRLSGPEQPLVRLVCFPFAGGGLSAYASWGDLLPAHVELVCVLPPGRGPRLDERPLEWVAELVGGLGPKLAADPHPRTYLFGHSLGAIVAFETARWLRRNAHPEPAGLLVSGSAAPQTPVTARAHLLPDDALLAHVGALGGTDQSLVDDERLRPLLLPALRADFAMHETYQYAADEPLACPVTAFAGSHDDEAPIEDVLGWGEQTAGPFQMQVLNGGHFFIASQHERLLGLLSEALEAETEKVP
ncbi:AMP-binding protein [Nonomuraea sp. NPDC050547]|uniref:AMP-binding protein n=1 Tax=Nonomuraea sp. NPDC050547 TaxID=3364368 RepID=UPI0037A7FCC1